MKNQILDEDLVVKQTKKKAKYIWLHASTAVMVMAIVYFFIYMAFIEGLDFSNRVVKAVVEDSFSILHLIMAMIFFNYSLAKGDYKLNVKGGYYVLLFGSGLFFIGASMSLFEGIIDSLALKHTLHVFWQLNYQHIITLLVIFVKLILIKPIASIISKTKKHVPTKK